MQARRRRSDRPSNLSENCLIAISIFDGVAVGRLMYGGSGVCPSSSNNVFYRSFPLKLKLTETVVRRVLELPLRAMTSPKRIRAPSFSRCAGLTKASQVEDPQLRVPVRLPHGRRLVRVGLLSARETHVCCLLLRHRWVGRIRKNFETQSLSRFSCLRSTTNMREASRSGKGSCAISSSGSS